MDGVNVETLRWSTLIENLRDANPTVPITVWCDEDTPLLWPEVLQAVSGHSAAAKLSDTDDLLTAIMSADGKKRMNAYLEMHPPPNPEQRRRVVSAFLAKFALPQEINVEIEMEGWSEDLVARMTEAYDLDVSRIIAMDGITFLAP